MGGNNVADVQRLTVVADPANANGSAFGGIRAGNAAFVGSSGVVGISAANVAVQDVVTIGDIYATDSASPALSFGSNSQFGNVTVAGGDLLQGNSKTINNAGYKYDVVLAAGTTSGGAAIAAANTYGQLSFTQTPASVASAAGKSMDLTANIDSGASFTGGSANDTFSATGTTLTAGDSLVGGTGTDRLNLTIVGAAGGALGVNAATAGVEQVSITNQHNAVNTLNADLMVGVTDIYYSGTAGITVTNVPSLPNAHLTSIVGTVTVGTTAAAKVGTADTVTVALNSAGVSAAGGLVYDGVETMNVVSGGTGSGSSANAFAIAGDALQNVVVSGAAPLFTNVTLSGASGTKTGSVDASAATAGVNITTAVPASGKVNLTGSSQNDTFTVTGAFSKTVVVGGGAGTDTLSIGAAIGYTPASTGVDEVNNGSGVTGFETLSLTAGVSQDMRALAGNTISTVNVANTGTTALTFAPTSIANLNIAEVGVTTAVSVTLPTVTGTGAATTTSNLLTANLGDTTAGSVNGVTVTTLSLADHKNIRLNSVGAANTVTTLTGTALNELTVTGDQNLTVTNAIAGATGLNKIDASAFTGSTLSVNGSTSTSAVTVSGGTATLTVTTGTGADTITAGGGNDSITAGTGNNSIVAGAGDDQVNIGATGSNNIDLGLGNDTVSGGSNSGNNTIVGGGGNDSITITGAGNNRVTLGATGTGGTSTVSLTGAGNNTILAGNLAGKLNASTGAGNDYIEGFDGADTISAGAGNDTIVAGGGNDSITIASLSSADSIDGGTGTDTLTISSVAFTAIPQTVTPSNIANIESIVLSTIGNADATTINFGNVSTVTALRIDENATTAAVTNTFSNLPATVATISLAETGANALETNAITYAAAPSALRLNVNGYEAAATNITGLSAPLTINGVLNSNAAGTARTYVAGDASSIGTMLTDASAVTVTVEALAAAVAGNELTTGALTANFIQSLSVSSNAFADVNFGGIGTNTSTSLSSVSLVAGANSTLASAAITNNTTATGVALTLNAGAISTLNTGNHSYTNSAVTVTSTLSDQAVFTATPTVTGKTIGTSTFVVGAGSTTSLPTLQVGAVTGTIGATSITAGAGSSVTQAIGAVNAPASIGAITLQGDGQINLTVNPTNAALSGTADAQGAISAAGMTNTVGKVSVNAATAISRVVLTGGAGADTLIGGTLADTITGGRGGDTLTGTGGAGVADVFVFNSIVGTASDSAAVTDVGNGDDVGQDSITDFNGDVIRVVATNVNDFEHGADTAIGTAGAVDDGTVGSFTVLTGLISLDGNANFRNLGDVAISLNAVANEAAFEAALQYNLTGTAAGDTLTGGGRSDTISGGDGADIITGGDAGDVLNGGSGNDTFVLAANTASSVADAAATSVGAAGIDIINVTAGDVLDFGTNVTAVSGSGAATAISVGAAGVATTGANLIAAIATALTEAAGTAFLIQVTDAGTGSSFSGTYLVLSVAGGAFSANDYIVKIEGTNVSANDTIAITGANVAYTPVP